MKDLCDLSAPGFFRLLFVSLAIASSARASQIGSVSFPDGPDAQMTPGSLCDNPNAYRYPERVPYCNRDVDGQTKWQVIESYDDHFDYTIAKNRADFKIDHLIPLCAGGSNEPTNLWPQHKSIYVQTDQIEDALCQVMAAGKIKQDDAVTLILDVKHHLEKAPDTLKMLREKLAH
jgi:hypothetical protein